LGELRRNMEITNGVHFVDDHEGSGQHVGTFQEEAMSVPELATAIVGQEGDTGDLGFLGKSLLGEGSVDTTPTMSPFLLPLVLALRIAEKPRPVPDRHHFH
jgi:hypothetical protein